MSADKRTLLAKARGAIGWSILNTLVGRLGSTAVGIILARILLPEDYGIFAVALVALNALLSVNELGVSLAIVRWPGDVGRIAPTVVSLSVLSSMTLLGAVLLLAPTLAETMNAPQATGVLRLLACCVLIDALTAVPAALMTREFMQRQRFLVDLVGFAATSGMALTLAANGFGAWSLAWSAVIGNLINGALILRYAPRFYRPGFNWDVAKELLNFGLPLALASLFLFALLNADYVVIGAHVQPALLGQYLLAFNLSTWPVTVFSAPARRVSLPAFARLDQGEGDASQAFVTACSAMLALCLPACLLLALFAGPAIAVVYGDKWAPAATVLPWLMVLALARVLSELSYDFLVAVDRSRATLVTQVVWLVALVPALVVGVRWDGIRGVAIAHAAIVVLVALPAYGLALRNAGVSLTALLAALARPVGACVLAAAAGVLVLREFSQNLTVLVVGTLAVCACYLVVVYPMRRIFMAAMSDSGTATPAPSEAAA